MPIKLAWSTAEDNLIHRLREDRATWDGIAAALGRSRSAVIERGRRIGAYRPPPPTAQPPDALDEPNRDPLPPGHTLAWAVLTENTLLEGSPYQ